RIFYLYFGIQYWTVSTRYLQSEETCKSTREKESLIDLLSAIIRNLSCFSHEREQRRRRPGAVGSRPRRPAGVLQRDQRRAARPPVRCGSSGGGLADESVLVQRRDGDPVSRGARTRGRRGRIACVSAPSVYQKLKQGVVLGSDRVSAVVLEFDRRFAAYGDDFVFYDYNEPLTLPPPAATEHSFDIVLADPPYLSEECLSKVSQTVRYLSKGKVLLCTGETILVIITHVINIIIMCTGETILVIITHVIDIIIMCTGETILVIITHVINIIIMCTGETLLVIITHVINIIIL
uniref:EEF1A lysine methyltransferase 1 n=1 Tax=Gasterosteus aculeatus aculeatus TaxID=481459 RepID=G3NB08_GASAC